MMATYPVTRLIGNCAQRLLEGHSANYRGVNLWFAPDRCLEVRVHRSWRMEETAAQEALDDLEFARCVVGELCKNSLPVARLIEGCPWRFIYLNENETGTAAVWCLETNALWWSASLS